MFVSKYYVIHSPTLCMTNSGVDTYSYQGWLNSDSFLKRAFGVFAYSFVASLIIGVILGILMVIASVIAVFVFGMAGL